MRQTIYLTEKVPVVLRLEIKVSLYYFRLSDLYQVYGGNSKDVQSNTGEENKTTSRYGKTGDIYSLVS